MAKKKRNFSFLKKIDRPLLAGWIIFIFSEIVAAVMIYCLYQFNIKDEEFNQYKPLYQPHAVGMPISLIIINGHGMIIFRLFPGIRTRTIKYIHGFIQTLVIGFFLYLLFVIYSFKEKTNHPKFEIKDLHFNQAYLTMIGYILQWIAAIFVYVYMYSNQRRRKMFAAWHNFFGFCTLQLAIATSCCMVLFQEFRSSKNESSSSLHGAIASVMMVLYGLLINVIVLNPYLEWPLVGPL